MARMSVNNLVRNGDFSSYPSFVAATTVNGRWIDGSSSGSTTNSAYGWAIPTGASAGTWSAMFDQSVKRGSSASMKISALDTSGAVVVSSYAVSSPYSPGTLIRVLPSTSYTLTAWVKTSSIASAGIRFRTISGAGATISTNLSTYISGTNEWTRVSVVFTTESNARFAAVMLDVTAGSIGSAWFTDVTLDKTAPTVRASANYRDIANNLVRNGGFDDAPSGTVPTTTVSKYIDGTATGSPLSAFPQYKWSIYSSSSACAFLYDTVTKRSSGASMRIDATTTGAYGSAMYGSDSTSAETRRTAIRVKPNSTYTLTGYCKTSNAAAAAAFMTVLMYTSTGTFSSQVSTSTLSGTNDWTKLTLTFTTSSSVSFLTILLRNNVVGSVSSVWFDDVSLVLSSSMSPVLERNYIDDMLSPNGYMQYIPSSNTPQTSNAAWMDGTATGSSTNTSHRWYVNTLIFGKGSAVFDPLTTIYGNPSLKLSVTATGGAVIVQNSTLPSKLFRVLPNTSYTLTYRMKTSYVSGSSTGGAYGLISQRDGNGAFISDTFGTLVTTTTDWTEYTITFTTAATARFAVIKLGNDGSLGAGTLIMDAWFSMVSLKKTTPQSRNVA